MQSLSVKGVVSLVLFLLVFCVVSLPEGFGAHRVFPHKTPIGHILELMFIGFLILFICYLFLKHGAPHHVSLFAYVIVLYSLIFVIYGVAALMMSSQDITNIVNDVRVVPWMFSYVFGAVLINKEQDFIKLFNVFVSAIFLHVLITVYLGVFDENSVAEINKETFISGSKRVWFRNSGLYFLLVAWTVIMLLSQDVKPYKKLVLFLVLFLTALSVMFTQSRMLIGLLLLMLAFLVFFSRTSNVFTKAFFLMLLSIFAVILVSFLEPTYIDVMLNRFMYAISFEDNSILTRLYTYRETVSAGMDYPVFGHGVGTGIMTSHPYVTAGDKEFHFVDNAFVSIFYKMGLIGIVLLSFLCFSYYKAVSRLKMIHMSPRFSVIISSLLFSLFFVFIYSFITGAFFLYTRSIVMVYFVILGAATSCVRANMKNNNINRALF